MLLAADRNRRSASLGAVKYMTGVTNVIVKINKYILCVYILRLKLKQCGGLQCVDSKCDLFAFLFCVAFCFFFSSAFPRFNIQSHCMFSMGVQ